MLNTSVLGQILRVFCCCFFSRQGAAFCVPPSSFWRLSSHLLVFFLILLLLLLWRVATITISVILQSEFVFLHVSMPPAFGSCQLSYLKVGIGSLTYTPVLMCTMHTEARQVLMIPQVLTPKKKKKKKVLHHDSNTN